MWLRFIVKPPGPKKKGSELTEIPSTRMRREKHKRRKRKREGQIPGSVSGEMLGFSSPPCRRTDDEGRTHQISEDRRSYPKIPGASYRRERKKPQGPA